MAAMEAANAHYTNGHHQQPGLQLPGSPTLTNPDMILPDYERSDSPDPDLDRADHALMMWKNAHAANTAPDMHQMFVATGLAGPHSYGSAGPVTPTTPIIYGNGTMLSDIGEVTEVESTVGRPSPARVKSSIRRPASPKRGSGKEGAFRSSPTFGAAPAAKKKSRQNLNAKHERRSSMESTSTITTADHVAAFADFDDSVSVDDSVFQGDDEESMASSYVEGTPAVEPARLGVVRVENLDRLSTYSTTSLSRRAEEILANAKKRLTTMEGNLSRARNTLHSGSPYGSEDGSMPSPPLQRASTAMYLPENGVDLHVSPTEHTMGHTRMSSDVAMQNGVSHRLSLPRSQSALGAAGGYRQPLTASKSADHIRGGDGEAQRPAHRASSVRDSGVKPLTEDEVARLGEADSASQNARLEAFLSPTFGSFSESGTRNPQRSSSAAQMRDIKDQMRDLKGKISSLREQARVDNMKRRSLQSLRTPSPFTHSQIDHWYTEPASNRNSEIIAEDALGRNPWDGEESSVDGGVNDAVRKLNGHAEDEETDYADAEEGLPFNHGVSHQPGPGPLSSSMGMVQTNGDREEDDVSDMQTENGDTDDDFHDAADVDYESESGESLYHDTVQHQISHEDREDAFDYEHFFLHSAMGTMSLARRASVESFTSDDSVETTRGPVGNETSSGGYVVAKPTILGRRNSSNSISTIDTFATAQEGRSLKSPVSPDEAYGAYEPSSRATSAQSHRYRSNSAAASKRHSFTSGSLHPPNSNTATRDSDGSISPIAEESSTAGSPAQKKSSPTARRASVIHRPISASLHRPSVSSFESVGTNRSFPLVNKPPSRPSTGNGAATTAAPPKANSTGVLTPRGGSSSPENDLNAIASRLMSDMGKQAQQQAANGTDEADGKDTTTTDATSGGPPHPLEALLREDKYLVERLVAGMGRCVLGLTENGRASAESRMYRRRLDAARRVLEGLDSV